MPINPNLIAAGRRTARALAGATVNAAKGVVRGGAVINNALQDMFPLEDTTQNRSGIPADFPALSHTAPESTRYNLKLLQETANVLGDTESKFQVDSIMDQMNDGFFQILFVGRFNTGKSTLLNHLLNRTLLPVDVIPTTKTLTWLVYSKQETACFQTEDETVYSIPINELSSLRDKPSLINIFAGVNADILRHGAILTDTPGLEASDADDKVTLDALQYTDAVILVVDAGIDVSAAEQRFIEYLRGIGKADKLFVVINKTDDIDNNERNEVIQARINVLSGLNVRARIFPLSCKDNTGLETFRKELIQFMDTGLGEARQTVIENRIRETAAVLSEVCKKANTLYGDEQTRHHVALVKEKIFMEEREIERNIKHNQNELNNLRRQMKADWWHKLGFLKDEVQRAVSIANKEQLMSPHQLLGSIQNEISRFLDDEFQRNTEAAGRIIQKSLNEISLPLPLQDTMLSIKDIKRHGWLNAIPPEAGSLGILAYSLFSMGKITFFSLLGWAPAAFAVIVLSPVFNKMFEQVKKIAGNVLVETDRKKLRADIEGQWGLIDESVCKKIDEYIGALSDYIGLIGRDTVACALGAGKRDIELIEGGNSGKSASVMNYQRQLERMI
jgi:small GTP-binding protein